MPGHRVGDVIPFGGCDDDPGACSVQEAESHHTIAAGMAGCQKRLIPMDFYLSVC